MWAYCLGVQGEDCRGRHHGRENRHQAGGRKRGRERERQERERERRESRSRDQETEKFEIRNNKGGERTGGMHLGGKRDKEKRRQGK